jgi:hypothetical protein
MLVKSSPGLKTPMEGKPREYINDTDPVEVASAYYTRLVDDGSLVVVNETRPAAPAKKGGDA